MDRAVFYEFIIVLLSVFALTAFLLRLIIITVDRHKRYRIVLLSHILHPHTEGGVGCKHSLNLT